MAAHATDGLAVLVVWFVLLWPTQPQLLQPLSLVRIPVEAVVVTVLVLALSRLTPRAPTLAAVVVGGPLGVLALLKVLQFGFFGVLDRPFNVVTDLGHLGAAVSFAVTSFGRVAGTAAVVAAGLLAVGVLIGVPLSVRRLSRLVQRRPRRSALAVVGVGALWAVAAVSGLDVEAHQPVAAADAIHLVASEVRDTTSAIRAQRVFDAAVAADAYRSPTSADLAALKGKQVLVVFVESYGRVAVDGSASEGVQAMLDADTRRLQASGFGARSAYLTSPTFGGISWLAHATLQSGVWVDNQRSYDRLLSDRRTTLASAFQRAGWRTVAVLPSDRGPWPQGQAFYGYNQVFDSSNLGYAGPGFGFSAMPDQYALEAFHRLQSAHRSTSPLMAEVDLASSHGPWAPLPVMVGWDQLGDGSAFDGIHARAESAPALLSHRDRVPAAYMTSVEYSLTALTSYIERYGDDDLVVVLLGDHQPATIVSGSGGNRDVPVTVVAHDPKVLQRISSWGWDSGLRPHPDAPVWRMSDFRDRFLAAYSSSATRPAGSPR